MRSRRPSLADQHRAPPGPKPNRAAFTRYLPSHNKGKATSSETLSDRCKAGKRPLESSICSSRTSKDGG